MPDKKLSFYECDKQMGAAFKVDCDELLEEFEKLKSVKFCDFAKAWQSKNFTLVFSGQRCALLLKDLCENMFYVVKKFIMLTTDVFKRIGGLYLLYGLYYKQPLKGWVKIRLTLNEFKIISSLIDDMRSQGEHDPVFVFAKMKVDHAFLFTAHQRQLGPEDRFAKNCDRYLDYAFNATKTENVLKKFNEVVHDSDLVNQIEKTNTEYQELMKKYSGNCPGLVPFTSTIVKDLKAASEDLERAESSKCKVPSPESMKKEVIESSKSFLKRKAMKNRNAIYRGKRKVKTAIDIDFGDGKPMDVDSDLNDDDM